jgi:hypothetical protein
MITQKLNYTFGKTTGLKSRDKSTNSGLKGETLRLKATLEQKFLLEFTGRHFPEEEAEKLWSRIIDHKWLVSESLHRNIGSRVAAVDYLQNFYRSPVTGKKESVLEFTQKFLKTIFYSISPPSVTRKYDY